MNKNRLKAFYMIINIIILITSIDEKNILKILTFCLGIFATLFLFTSHARALYKIPTYIELNFTDIDYNYAQYIKFTIESDGDGYDYKIVLYMRNNDGDGFSITYKISELAETGELNDENSDKLTIYLHADEYEGKKVTFNSYDYDPNLSFTRYVELWGEKGGEQDYSGGEAEIEKIQIYGYGFKLYFIAIDDDGNFFDPTWEINVEDENWDNKKEFTNDGHQYSTATLIEFKNSYIHVTEDPTANALPLPYYSGTYPLSYGYFPSPFLHPYRQPFGYDHLYRYNQTYAWGEPYGYNQVYSGQPYRYGLPYGYGGLQSHGYPQYNLARYAFQINPKEPYGGYIFKYNYPLSIYTSSNPYPPLPSGIFNLLASSNLNTALKGIELMHDYWPPY